MSYTKEQLQEIKQSGIFDFVSNNWHQLTKEQLAELIKEYSYAVYSIDKEIEQRALNIALEEIEED